MLPSTRFLLFAIKPPADVADAIDDERRALDIDRRYSADRFHITLLPIGPRDRLGEQCVERCLAVAGAIRSAAFRVNFDRVESTVLRSSDTIRGLIAFQRVLVGALIRGQVVDRRRYVFRPHITLSYGCSTARAQDIDGISWLVEYFVLIESVHREGRHVELGRWPLPKD